MSHKYSRKKDFVDAVDVRKYIADHDEVQDDLSYFITYDLETASAIENSGLSWISIFLVLLAICCASYGAYRLYYEYDVPARGNYKEGKNIGGWLILLAIGLVFTPIGIIVQLLSEEGYYDAYTWSALWNTDGLSGKPMVIVIALEMIINVALVIYSAILIILFFKKRTVVPKLMIVLYASMLILLILDTVAANLLAPDLYSAEENQEFLKDIVKGVFKCAIWIPYFLMSERVKETFVNRGPNYVEPKEANHNILVDEKIYPQENSKPYDSLENRFSKDD